MKAVMNASSRDGQVLWMNHCKKIWNSWTPLVTPYGIPQPKSYQRSGTLVDSFRFLWRHHKMWAKSCPHWEKWFRYVAKRKPKQTICNCNMAHCQGNQFFLIQMYNMWTDNKLLKDTRIIQGPSKWNRTKEDTQSSTRYHKHSAKN